LKGYTPFNFIKFLNHCARLILLKKVGGGYIFIHRMLLEYFAEMTAQSTKDGTKGSVGLSKVTSNFLPSVNAGRVSSSKDVIPCQRGVSTPLA
jgi:hypothetical protein